jgi:hypothetical protein
MLVIWILSFPLRNFSIFGGISVDNILVPVLAVLWLGAYGYGKERIRLPAFIPLLGAMAIGLALDSRMIQGGLGGFGTSLWTAARSLGYFLLPLLLVSSVIRLRYTNASIIVIACAGAVSALLVSAGFLQLEYVRFEESRIGVAALPKATGVFTNFGDMAMLAGYTVVCLMMYRKHELPFGLSTVLGKLAVSACLFLGLVGTQSRNYLLSIFLSLGAYKYVQFLVSKPPTQRRNLLLGSLTGAIVVGAFAIMFAGNIADGLSNIGGGRAANTAQARVSSYEQAADLLGSAIAWGIDYRSADDVALAEQVHNIWIGLMLRGGVINVSVIAGLILAIFSGALKVLAVNAQQKEALVIASFMSVVLLSTLFYPGRSLIFWFILGVCSTILVRRRDVFLQAARR